jgi:hypothetical protein
MSPGCKLAAVLVGIVCAGSACAEEAVSEPACAADVCVVNVLAARLIPPPCAADSVLVAYSKSSGATLIQCSSPSDAQENKGFIYDRLDHGVRPFEFLGGRFIRPDSFGEVEKEGVPDKFGRVPLCPAKGREAPARGELLIVEKQPNESDSEPYCYRVNYVLAGKGSLTIRGDDGRELPAMPEKAAAQWAKAQETLSQYIDAGPGNKAAMPARTASVISNRAGLFVSPHAADASKIYLVKGDKVEVLDDSKIADGWCLVRYVTKAGKSINRWAHAQDLDVHSK